MSRLIIISMLALAMPLTGTAQDDDLYFVPTKANVKKSTANYGMPKDTYYCGSSRDVDEYNRRLRSTVEPIEGDSAATDVIAFDAVKGEYPDSLAQIEEDYKCTRKMSRWDDDYREAYWNGYTDGRFNRWYGWSTFYDPWYYGSWYGGWYDPWYYGYGGWYGWGGYGWYGWYDPWYHGWGGYYPYYHYPVYVYGGGGSRHYGERDRFIDSRFDRVGTGRFSGGRGSSGSREMGRNIANRDRASNISNSNRSSRIYQRFGNDNTNSNSQRYNNSVRSNDNRQSSFSNSRSYSGSSNSGSFSSGSSSRSFGGGGVRSSGGGVRMGGRR